jgi:hypothetical protein
MMRRPHDIARQFHCDEDGTSITEFVITLPVFVLSFIAILHLYGLGDHALRGTGTAYARALQDYKEVQTDWIPVDWAVNPVSAGTEAGIWHWKVSESRARDKTADEVFDTVPIGAGHMAESYSRLVVSGPPSWTAETVKLDPPNAHITVNSLVTMADSKSPVTGDVRYGHRVGGTGSVFAAELMSDTVNITGLSGKKGWMGYMNGLIDTAGARPAFAAGMRYGVTTDGEYDETVNFMKTDYPIQTSTHIAVPPRPTSKWITVAVIRAYLAQDDAYNESMLAFQMDVNTSDPAAQKAQECKESLEGIGNPTNWGEVAGVMGDIKGGDPCGNGVSAGSGNPISFITGPLQNAASFFGGPVPDDTDTDSVPNDSPF